MSAPPSLPPIQTLTAPLVLGELFSMYLFGVLSVQVYIYYLTFPKDANYIKAFVYSIFILELAAIIMCISDTYHWFAVGFGSVAALNNVQLSPVDTPMLGAFVAAGVQMFYCYRIYTINNKAWWVSVVVALLALAQTGAGIYSAVVAERAGMFSSAEAAGKVTAYLEFISTAVADIIIATAMIALLLQSRRNVRVASHRTTSMIMKVMNVIVETNLASASVAIITVVLIFALPDTNYFTCPSLILGRIYSNSLLLILNNRYYLATGSEVGSSNGIFKKSRSETAYETPNVSTAGYSKGTGGGNNTSVRVELDTVTETYQGHAGV